MQQIERERERRENYIVEEVVDKGMKFGGTDILREVDGLTKRIPFRIRQLTDDVVNDRPRWHRHGDGDYGRRKETMRNPYKKTEETPLECW